MGDDDVLCFLWFHFSIVCNSGLTLEKWNRRKHNTSSLPIHLLKYKHYSSFFVILLVVGCLPILVPSFSPTLALVDLPYAVVNICLQSVFDLTAHCWLLLSRQWMQKE
jgi:hypothetical protein